ncbi:MAG: isoaspartyl peptidase/L-asparaginase [Cyclobacteriaceae bacterium]|nr:isoaspartyl peptidase/L-asparaginase [Cyclobacteriaceae bacterium]
MQFINKPLIIFLFSSILVLAHYVVSGQHANYEEKVVLVIHGGAGTISKDNMSDDLEIEYRKTLSDALNAGYEILKSGGSSLEAVRTSIRLLEDSPLFNAGKGAVLTNKGFAELDASIMQGADLRAGAVAGVRKIKNPIDAAIEVMQASPHVMLSGNGAENFAKSRNLVLVKPNYFVTKTRIEQLRKVQEKDKTSGSLHPSPLSYDKKYGTVGAVALDVNGDLTAGTSTGGMTNKKFGRIGDSPIIGAGTYANNSTCGISCTGHGEYFMRFVVAYDVAAKMEYEGKSLQAAASEVVWEKLEKAGGKGGLIGLDAKGNVTMPFNTEGMYRGYITESGSIYTFIFKDE